MKNLNLLSMAALAAAILAGGYSSGAKKSRTVAAPVSVARAFTTNVPAEIDPRPSRAALARD